MANQNTIPSKRIRHSIGENIRESIDDGGTSISFGRIVAIATSSSNSDKYYIMARNFANDTYAIYASLMSANCRPFVTRTIPGDALIELIQAGMGDVELPEIAEKKSKSPVIFIEKNDAPKVDSQQENELPPITPLIHDEDEEDKDPGILLPHISFFV